MGALPLPCSHDDEVSQESTKLVLKIADARQNPNGCKLPLTWCAALGACRAAAPALATAVPPNLGFPCPALTGAAHL